MDRTSAVESDLSDIKPGAKILNELLDIPVVHHVALGCFKESLTVPQVVGDVIADAPEFEVVFEYPKSRCDPVLLIVPVRWEYENESSDIGGGCQAEAATTNPAFQLTHINRVCVLVPYVRGHPPHRLFQPLIEPQLAECSPQPGSV